MRRWIDSVIDRRTFLAGTGAVLLAAPLAAEAQQAGKVPRVGFLLPGSRSESVHRVVDEFRQGLRELGYVEGQTIAIEYRWAEELGPPEIECRRRGGV
jgi:putative tryptophan/tyrosine transport system substrate-binding protein